MLKKIFYYFFLLILIIQLISCSDSNSNELTPADVTLSNVVFTYDAATHPPDILAWITGIATNSGQRAALYVQIQIELLDEHYKVISTSSWQTIFEVLNGGVSSSFIKSWLYPYPSTVCYQAPYYRINVIFISASAASESIFSD